MSACKSARWLSVSTVTCRRRLPIIERIEVGVIGGFHTQLALIGKVFDRTTEGHATLVFLLTAGFDGAVAFFVRLEPFRVSQGVYGSFTMDFVYDDLAKAR